MIQLMNRFPVVGSWFFCCRMVVWLVLIDASVPREYLPLFIGHKVWTRPQSKGHGEAMFHQLLDVWQVDRPGDYPEYLMWCLVGERAMACSPAHLMYVQGVESSLCSLSQVETRFGLKPWWEFKPAGETPPMPVYPLGWRPKQPTIIPSEIPLDDVPILPPPVEGDQFILPI